MTKRYICTWAQNNTAVYQPFWKNLKAYAKKIDARVLVQAGFYKVNQENEEEDDVCWDASVISYLTTKQETLGPNCYFFANVPIRATAERPLSGFQGFGNHLSGVFGHPKWHLECHAVVGKPYPKLQQTTGSCTVPNYTLSKAGAKAAFHHFFGFTIVEVVNNKVFHMRRVSAESETGAFIDVCDGKVWRAEGGKVKLHREPALALVVGDSHAEESCEQAVAATQDMITLLKPQRVVGNDLVSMSGVSKHDKGKTFTQFQKSLYCKTDVTNALLKTIALMERLGITDVVESNHHDHLDQWLDDPAGHFDHENSKLWHRLNLAKRMEETSGFQTFCRYFDADVQFHRTLRIGDVAIVHGHEGANGARGLKAQGSKLGSKIISAHTHSPFGLGGHDIAGHTSKYDHGYNNPSMSSWLQGNVVLHSNGKRQHLHIIEGSWRT